MQAFADFLLEKLQPTSAEVEVLDNNDHHLLIKAVCVYDWCLHKGVSERIIIPFLTRFTLFTTQRDLDEILTITVRSLGSNLNYLIATRQENRGNRYILQISITAVQL